MTTHPSNAKRRLRSMLAFLTLTLVTLAACSSDPIPIAVPASSGESAGAAAQAAPPVTSTSSEFGDILVNRAGLSVYGFTNDVDGVSTCDGGCADAWPPVLVEDAAVPAGLDPAVFSVISRADGTNQLKAGIWPLYLFAGDTAPGQTTGHLSGDVWFLATPQGTLIGVAAPEPPPAESQAVDPAPATSAAATVPLAATATTSGLGDILVNENGLTLYGFTNDVDGVSTCDGGCADAWPPVLVEDAAVPAGLDPAVFSVILRADGTNQLKAGVWPLYLFAGDTAPGQTTGHLSGDVWFAVSPTGTLIDGPAPAAPAPAAPAPAEPAAAESAAESGSDGYGATAAATPAVAVANSPVGDILVDDAGLSLYGFTKDVDGTSTCVDGCADSWPPVLVASAEVPSGLDASTFSVITRGDGTYQLRAGIWPLYRFAGDTAPGQTTGHLSGDVWFLVAPDAKLIGFVPPAAQAPTAVPTAVPAPTAAPTPAPVATVAPTPAPAPEPVPTPTAGYGYDTDDAGSDY